MTLGAARSLMRNIILERQPDTGLVTDTEANELLNSAARLIFIRIATKYPDVFAQRSAASIPIAVGATVPFSTISSGIIFRILNAYGGPTGISEGLMDHIEAFDRTSNRQVYEPAPSPPLLPYRWYVEGDNVGFTPRTSAGFDVRFAWVETPPTMVNDSDLIWSGKLTSWHDFVALFGGSMASTKDSGSIVQLYTALDTMLQENFGVPYTAQNTGRYNTNPYAIGPRESRP